MRYVWATKPFKHCSKCEFHISVWGAMTSGFEITSMILTSCRTHPVQNVALSMARASHKVTICCI